MMYAVKCIKHCTVPSAQGTILSSNYTDINEVFEYMSRMWDISCCCITEVVELNE